MKHFLDPANSSLWAYEPDGSQDHLIPPRFQPLTNEEVAALRAPPATPEAIQQRLTESLNIHLDAVAAQRRYDDRFTCALRAGFAGPFQQEGLAFAAWMDACNVAAYMILAECKAGLRPIPTEEDLIAAMPLIEWPPSPIPEGAV